MTPQTPLIDRQDCALSATEEMLAELPGRVRDIATLRGLGYSCMEIGRRLGITPQAVSATLMRHRRRVRDLGGTSDLLELSARAANALTRLGIHRRADVQGRDLFALLRRERNCGAKTLEEIRRWLARGEDDAWNVDEP